ncbi:hypothetical protein WOLCODRAFT_18298 [Wolfiporia cocos MD-104 SS10]|uniref:Uncharacterized protein n=1 Tax=Wolfiporia cocos (strain MD-104) TaxID=742152 RepID=A0A2H3JM94_WOLCO|nr:hypothetical protein WOLCODRAFT_18298 [Wolfiporia cocos MD-104 SS10]
MLPDWESMTLDREWTTLDGELMTLDGKYRTLWNCFLLTRVNWNKILDYDCSWLNRITSNKLPRDTISNKLFSENTKFGDILDYISSNKLYDYKLRGIISNKELDEIPGEVRVAVHGIAVTHSDHLEQVSRAGGCCGSYDYSLLTPIISNKMFKDDCSLLTLTTSNKELDEFRGWLPDAELEDDRSCSFRSSRTRRSRMCAAGCSTNSSLTPAISNKPPVPCWLSRSALGRKHRWIIDQINGIWYEGPISQREQSKVGSYWHRILRPLPERITERISLEIYYMIIDKLSEDYRLSADDSGNKFCTTQGALFNCTLVRQAWHEWSMTRLYSEIRLDPRVYPSLAKLFMTNNSTSASWLRSCLKTLKVGFDDTGEDKNYSCVHLLNSLVLWIKSRKPPLHAIKLKPCRTEGDWRAVYFPVMQCVESTVEHLEIPWQIGEVDDFSKYLNLQTIVYNELVSKYPIPEDWQRCWERIIRLCSQIRSQNICNVIIRINIQDDTRVSDLINEEGMALVGSIEAIPSILSLRGLQRFELELRRDREAGRGRFDIASQDLEIATHYKELFRDWYNRGILVVKLNFGYGEGNERVFSGNAYVVKTFHTARETIVNLYPGPY